MTMGTLNRKTALFGGIGVAAILLLRFGLLEDRPAGVVVAGDSVPLAERRLAKLQTAAASVPGREELLRQARLDLSTREKGILAADTASQAQAQLIEIVRRVGKSAEMDVRGVEDLRVGPLSNDYGEVTIGISFTCGIDQLVNFLSGLANEPALLATKEIRISSTSPKDKMINVRVDLSAVVPRKLVPVKKGADSF